MRDAGKWPVSPVKPSNFRPPSFDVCEWWKETVIYQIYPLSFKDTSGNGMGDLKGIRLKLPYFKWLGIKALWLNLILCSPLVDHGYDVTDYLHVDPIFGGDEELNLLLDEMHRLHMFLVMDLVPNHTSDQHKWFTASRAGEPEYKDYYIWRDGLPAKDDSSMPLPPNNWTSVFGSSAWTWCAQRGQYYLHTFMAEQPDLNYRNQQVRQEMNNVIQYWLDKGVDGFRVDSVVHLVKDADFGDGSSDDQCMVDHAGCLDLVREWADLCSRVGRQKRKHILLFTEGYADLPVVVKYYSAGVTFPMNFALVNWKRKTKADELVKLIQAWQDAKPDGLCSNWQLGNHDQSRVLTRLGDVRYAVVAHCLLLLLPGTPICYYGDELGMVDLPAPTVKSSSSPLSGRYNRQLCRAPVSWSPSEPNHGFTTCPTGPWLPLVAKPELNSVEAQMTAADSCLNHFKQLLQIRALPVFSCSSDNLDFVSVSGSADSVVAFTRSMEGFPTYLVVVSIGPPTDNTQSTMVNLSAADPSVEAANVIYDSSHCYKFRQSVRLGAVGLVSPQALVLSFEPCSTNRRRSSDY